MNRHISVTILLVMVALGTTSMLQQLQRPESAHASTKGNTEIFGQHETLRKVPIATSGDSIYVVWWTNKTGNDEVQFRTSTDGGARFADKINLSNTNNTDSVDAEVAAEGDSVIVTWWERNSTSNEPVIRISTDNGETFGPLLRLATNGTIGGEGG